MNESSSEAAGRRLFGDSLYRAAEQAVLSGHVLDCRVLKGGAVVTGVVSAAAGEAQPASKFRVYIRNLPAKIDGECSCGQRGVCIHVAAVSIAASGATRSGTAEQQMAAARSDAVKYGAQQLCYVLEKAVGSGVAELQVSAWVAQVAPDGSSIVPASACAFVPRFSRLSSAAGAGLDFPRYLDSTDRNTLVTLTQQNATGPWHLQGAVGAAVLAQIVSTGRAFRHSLQLGDARVLRPGGASRRLTFRWELLPNGDQGFSWEGCESLDVAASLEPPMYIDAALSEVGRIDLPFEAEVLRELVRHPPVAPEQILAINAKIDAIATGLPRLNPVSPAAQPLVSLCPRLVLSADEQAVVCFIYNGVVVDGRRLVNDASTVRLVSDGALIEVPRDVEREQSFHAQLKGVLGRPPDTRAGWLAFMLEGVPKLVAAGWEVVPDAAFPYRTVTAQQWYGNVGADQQRSAWFNLRLGVIVDGQQVNLLEALTRYLQSALAGTAEAGSGGQSDASGCRVGDFWLVRLDDGRYLPIAMKRIERIAHTLVELFDRESLTAERALALPRAQGTRLAQLAMELSEPTLQCNDSSLSTLIEGLQRFSGIRALAAPADFQGELRLYQQEGLGWLQFLRELRLGGVLADDMGLGKTVQTIAHIALEVGSGRLTKPVLIVAPVSALGNWQQELARFAPNLSVHTWHGAQRRRNVNRLRSTQVILTAYPLLLIDSELLLAQEYGLVILDEAQMIKNPHAKVSQMARALRAQYRLCLSGTPVENHLGELWSLFDFLQPGLLGDERHFQRHYRTPIERNGDQARAQALRTRLAPFLLRRTKDAVAKELPPKMEMVESLTLDERQRDFYDGVRLAMHQRIQEIIRQQGLARSQITILDALLKLRQVCCDPRLVNIPEAATVSASVPSAKLEWLATALPEMIAAGRRILLFSQFTSMLRLIEPALTELGIRYCMLTGDTQDRTSLVTRFQSGEVPLFLISLKAGGTALNLTAADTVIHYDPWWNPAVEAQATDRAHRIGQTKSVFVYKLIAQDTVEERMLQLQASKRGLADQLYTEKSSSPGALTAQDLEMLLAP